LRVFGPIGKQLSDHEFRIIIDRPPGVKLAHGVFEQLPCFWAESASPAMPVVRRASYGAAGV
jgi:hypothetical protein